MERITSSLFSIGAIAPGAVSLNGRTYEPDVTKGYMTCTFSHTWPVVTFYGECLAPLTVGRSSNSILHQPVNREHRMRVHDPEHRIPDEVIGCIVDCACGIGRDGRLPQTVESAPGIDAVATVFKQAHNVDKLIGGHQSGRQTFVVSMEVMYNSEESGFVYKAVDGTDPESDFKHTPDTWRRAGLVYMPVTAAREELAATRDFKHMRMRDKREDGKGYCGQAIVNGAAREVYWVMGGPDGQVHYGGLGIVRYGAEPSARIVQMLAHASPEDQGVEEAASELVKRLQKAVDEYLVGAGTKES